MKIIYSLRRLHGVTNDFIEKQRRDISVIARKYRNFRERKKIKKDSFTIISNTCIGGVICHDLGKPFLSPTVNIYIRPKDFVKFCMNIKHYLEIPLTEIPYNADIGYPVARLDDIVLYCKHFKDFDEANDAWNRRKARIDWDNVYFIMTDRDFIPPVSITNTIQACDEDDIRKFDLLPFTNKICIVRNADYVKKYESCRLLLRGNDSKCVGIITNIIGITGKRMYQYVENFDYIQFLNGE